MKIILKYIFTNVKEHKARTFVMLLSIFLSAVLLFVSFSIGISYENAQRKMARGMAGSAAISVTSTEGYIDIDDIPKLSSIDTSVGILEKTVLYYENGYYETIDLIATDIEQLNQINPPRLADGKEISNFFGNQIILPNRFTSKYKIEKGDTITLQIDRKPINLEVSEIAVYDNVFLRHTRGATALIPLSTLSTILGQTDIYNKILIKPTNGISTSDLKNELILALSDNKYQVSEIVNELQIVSDARQKSMPFFLISFFSLTMSVFIIYSSYKVITLDRLPIIGTFRSIGATKKDVIRILMLESLLYGGIGGLISIPIGIIVLKLILQGMGQSLSQGIEIPVVISPLSIIFSVMVALIVSVFSAWFPAHHSSNLPIKNVVLGVLEEKQASQNFIIRIGIVLFIISILLPKIVTGNLLYLAGGFSLLGLIVAAILVIPIFTNLISIGLEHFYSFTLGNLGKLAARNMRDNKNIIQNITLLFISISAIIAITTVGNFVTAYISDVFNGAELQGFADGYMEQDFIDYVKDMDGVQKVLPIYVFDNQVQANGITFSRLEATDNLDWYSSMLAINYTDKKMKATIISNFTKERTILLSENYIEQTDFSIGDTITLSNGVKQSNYIIIGSFKSRATDVEAVISSNYAILDFNARAYNFLVYTAVNPEAIMIQIRDLFGDTPNWSRTVEEFNTDALSTVGAFLKPMHSMTWFILLLVAVGIINNLLINYIQKRRTIAMYKSIGLSNLQNIKMTLIESFSSGLIGGIIAIFISYIEIQTIFIVAGPKISMTPKLNIETFLISGVMGIVITLIGSIIPIFKSHQMKLVEEIKFE